MNLLITLLTQLNKIFNLAGLAHLILIGFGVMGLLFEFGNPLIHNTIEALADHRYTSGLFIAAGGLGLAALVYRNYWMIAFTCVLTGTPVCFVALIIVSSNYRSTGVPTYFLILLGMIVELIRFSATKYHNS